MGNSNGSSYSPASNTSAPRMGSSVCAETHGKAQRRNERLAGEGQQPLRARWDVCPGGDCASKQTAHAQNGCRLELRGPKDPGIPRRQLRLDFSVSNDCESFAGGKRGCTGRDRGERGTNRCSMRNRPATPAAVSRIRPECAIRDVVLTMIRPAHFSCETRLVWEQRRNSLEAAW